jgi:hypothetical protein
MIAVEANFERIKIANETILSAKRHWGYLDELIEICKPELLMTAESIKQKSV